MESLVVKRLASSFVGRNSRAFCGAGQAIGKAVASNWKQLIVAFACVYQEMTAWSGRVSGCFFWRRQGGNV